MVAREIANNIRTIVGPVNVPQTYVCKVERVSNTKKICDVIRVFDDKKIPGVRLNATITAKEGLIITPKIDSFVLVTDLHGENYFVSQYSQVDKIQLDFDTEIAINGGNNGKIVINGGKYGGIIDINELQKRLKNLEKAFNDHTHASILDPGSPPSVPPSAPLMSAAGPVTGTIPPPLIPSMEFQMETNHPYGYENDKIKH